MVLTAAQGCGGDEDATSGDVPTTAASQEVGQEAREPPRFRADPPPKWTPAKKLAEQGGLINVEEGSDVHLLDYWVVAAVSRKLPPVAVDVQREDTVGLIVTTSAALGLRDRASVASTFDVSPSKPETIRLDEEPASRMRWVVETPTGPVTQERISVLRKRSGFRITYSAPARYFAAFRPEFERFLASWEWRRLSGDSQRTRR
jgi:hypothetical protein